MASLREVICDAAVENNDAEGKINNEGRQEEMTTNTNINNLNHKESFDSQYSTGKLPGKGGCGSVYEGVCKADGKQKSEGCKNRSESSSIQIVSNGEMKLEVLEDSHQPQASSKPPAMASLREVICDAAVENNDAEGKIDNEGRQEEMTTNTNLNNLNHKESFDSQYSTGKLLGKGGCGSVYEGVCKADGKQVAIKYVSKTHYQRFTTIPEETDSLPVEVAFMQMVSRPPCSPHVLKLLEWFDTPQQHILILERPVPCIDLLHLVTSKDKLSMELARHIMWQVVLATRHCHDRGVLHRDIKLQNVLINTDTLEVKLIDFGCGDLLKETPYKTFAGTRLYAPPEWITIEEYHGCPAAVWSLGVLLFLLVCGRLPFRTNKQIVDGRLFFKHGVSKACSSLIEKCLQKNPSKRPSLEEILQDEWFEKEREYQVQTDVDPETQMSEQSSNSHNNHHVS
ncbi:serine/threonine-protein kinase pim-1-like [Trichomycterus rosablanca]|uniref:serine/threonine-protein kinase pim-1-like n=1 Tax=Trichomycterus rosablanca TaxID=2290929 RepID=UPI002F357B83